MNRFLYVYRVNGEIYTWLTSIRGEPTERNVLMEISRGYFKGRDRDCVIIPLNFESDEADVFDNYCLHAKDELNKSVATIVKTMLTLALRIGAEGVKTLKLPDDI